MTPKSKNILVGFFVVGLTIGAIAFTTWLGSTAIREEMDTFVAYLDEAVSGLSPNSPVKYKGVTIGQVELIEINPKNSNQVALTLKIKKGTPIKEDSTLVLTSQGITGLQYIEITGGSEDIPLLTKKRGEAYPVIPSDKSTLATVQAAVGPLLGNINLTIGDIRQILKSANPDELAQILGDVHGITSAFSRNSDQLFNDLNETGSHVRDVAAQTRTLVTTVNEFVGKNQEQLGAILDQVGTTAETLNRIMLTIEKQKMIQRLDSTLAHAENLMEGYQPEGKGAVAQMISSMQQSSSRLDRLLKQVEDSQIILHTSQTVNQAKTVVASVEQASNQVNAVMLQLADSKLIDTAKITIDEVGELVANVNKQIDGPFVQTLKNVQQSSERFNGLLSEIEKQQVVQQASGTMGSIASLTTDIHQSTQELNKVLSRINDTQLVEETEKTVMAVNVLTTLIKQQVEGPIAALLDDVKNTSRDVSTLTKAIQEKKLVEQTEVGMAEFNALLKNARQKMNGPWADVINEVGKSSKSVRQLLQDLEDQKLVAQIGQTMNGTQDLVQSLSQASGKAEKIMDGVDKTIASADAMLLSIGSSVSDTATQANQLVGSANQTNEKLNHWLDDMKKTGQQTNQLIGNADQASQKFSLLIDDLRKSSQQTNQFLEGMEETRTDVGKLTRQFNALLNDKQIQALPTQINTTLKEIQGVSQMLNQTAEASNVEATMDELQITLKEIQEFAVRWSEVAETLKNNPSTLIFGGSNQEIDVTP